MTAADVDDRAARMGLACVVGHGDPRLADLVRRFGATAVWASLSSTLRETPWARRARGVDLPQVVARTGEAACRFLVPTDPEWPAALGDLAGVTRGDLGGEPMGLWVSGPGRLGATGVAMVGSRASTGYGDHVAMDMAAELTAAGVTVISGGAYGIDAAAHRGALSAGPTVAVMASGLAQPYPRGNASLLEAVRESGLLISEHPPDQVPTRVGFLSRNRMIAALGAATIIVEAAVRSGASNTVSWAHDLNRPVMAVPGPITSAMSQTPHRLIRDCEATLITTAADVLSVVRPLAADPAALRGVDGVLDTLEPGVLTVFEAMPGRGAVGSDEVLVATGLAPRVVMAALSELAEAGLVRQADDGGWALAQRVARPRGVTRRGEPALPECEP